MRIFVIGTPNLLVAALVGLVVNTKVIQQTLQWNHSTHAQLLRTTISCAAAIETPNLSAMSL